MPDDLARRFLHVNLNCRSARDTEALYAGVMGLRARMRTDKTIATDGSILGLAGETYCETAFLYDSRGAKNGCALEVIEYHDPALKLDDSRDPVRPGLRSALLTVSDLDQAVRVLRDGGHDVGDVVTGLISGSRAVLVTDPDGVVVEIGEDVSVPGGGGARFSGVRMATSDVAATAQFLCAIGFREVDPPAPVVVADTQLAPGRPGAAAECLVARYVLPEDDRQFSVVVVQHPRTIDDPVPWGGNRQGLYRCALRVENVRAALAQVPDSVQVMGDPVWCPLPGTKIDGLFIAFLRSPDGVVFEFVERPLSFFSN